MTDNSMQQEELTAAAGSDGRAPRGIDSVYPPLVLLLSAVALIYAALDYGDDGRQLPLLVGGVAALLAVLDLLSRRRGPVGAWLRDAPGAGFAEREMKYSPPLAAELRQAAWLAVCIGLVLLVGLLPGVPLFVFLHAWRQGRQPLRHSTLAAILVAAACGLVFEFALDYQLYRGLLFGGRG